jgi:hypothetical protein
MYLLYIVDAVPATLQTSAWYSGVGFVGLLVPVAIALFAFRTSLGGYSWN